VIIDPHIAVIRIPREPGSEFYDAVLDRVSRRREQPQGILMHFAAERGDEFVIWTVFRDNAAMLEGFVAFSAMESQNEMVERGIAFDMARDTYPLLRMYVEQGVTAHRFANVPAGNIGLCTSDLLRMTPDSYRAMGRETGWFDTPIPGRIAHVAHELGGHVATLEFWETREAGEAAYRERAHAAYERHHPGELSDEVLKASWLTPHSFVVTAEPGDGVREFLRETSGPMKV
jgi:hypothetical protein